MPSENDFFYLEKCQAKLVSVRLNEMKFLARTLFTFDFEKYQVKIR